MGYLSSFFHKDCAVVEHSCNQTHKHNSTAMPDYRIDLAIAVPSSWSSLFRYSLKRIDLQTGRTYDADLNDPELLNDNHALGMIRILGSDRTIVDDSVKASWSSELCNKFCEILARESDFACSLEISKIGVVHNDTNQILETVIHNRSFTEIAILKVQHYMNALEIGLQNWINSGNVTNLIVEDSAVQMDFTFELMVQPQVIKIIDGSDNDNAFVRIMNFWDDCPESLQGKEVKLRLPPMFENFLTGYGKYSSAKGAKSTKSFIFVKHKNQNGFVVIIEILSVIKANLFFR
ncbi:hypothetical protein L596_021598 [Steinernema carpocapsae]|uniref:Uncharacterized protein n=1 Tax=Steinernema carpocapsae TaxID=34508 RepID=A0A4V6A062_STECR|nr:hypothetical protein L596_021598 [Steinernema carpocapsae]